MKEPKIFLYGIRNCAYCSAARYLLTKKNLRFMDVALDEDRELRAEIRLRSGRNTVPQIWIGDRHIGGYTDLYDLDQRGELHRCVTALGEGCATEPA